MGCADELPVFRKRIPVDSQVEHFDAAVQKFIESLGIGTWYFGLRILQYTGDIEVNIGLEYAKVRPRKPEAVAAISGTWTTLASGNIGTTLFFSHTVTGSTDKFWVRWGVLSRLPNANSTRGYVDIELRAWKKQCARLGGQRQFEATPDSTQGNILLVTVSDFVPTIAIDKFRAAFIYSSTKDLEYQFYCRTAKDPEAANDWVAMNGGTWAALTDGADGVNTGDISIPAGADAANHLLIQFAIALRMKSAGTNPRGVFRVVSGNTYT